MNVLYGFKLRSWLSLNFFLSIFVGLIALPALALEAVNLPASPSPSSPPIIVKKKTPLDQPLEAILPVNVNTTDAKTLMRVPGINRKAARQIVNHRDRNGKYFSIDQLAGFSGISETSVLQLKKYLTVK